LLFAIAFLEVRAGVLGRDAHRSQSEAAADRFRDTPEENALVGGEAVLPLRLDPQSTSLGL